MPDQSNQLWSGESLAHDGMDEPGGVQWTGLKLPRR